MTSYFYKTTKKHDNPIEIWYICKKINILETVVIKRIARKLFTLLYSWYMND